MRRQYRYNEKPRRLDREESTILKQITDRSGIEIPIISVAYERHQPRATLCIIKLDTGWVSGFGMGVDRTLFGVKRVTKNIYGVTMKSRSDTEQVHLARLLAFRRALEDYVELEKANRKQ